MFEDYYINQSWVYLYIVCNSDMCLICGFWHWPKGKDSVKEKVVDAFVLCIESHVSEWFPYLNLFLRIRYYLNQGYTYLNVPCSSGMCLICGLCLWPKGKDKTTY